MSLSMIRTFQGQFRIPPFHWLLFKIGPSASPTDHQGFHFQLDAKPDRLRFYPIIPQPEKNHLLEGKKDTKKTIPINESLPIPVPNPPGNVLRLRIMEDELSFLANAEGARQSVDPVRPIDPSLLSVRSPPFLEPNEQKSHREKPQKVSRSRVQVHA